MKTEERRQPARLGWRMEEVGVGALLPGLASPTGRLRGQHLGLGSPIHRVR